MQSQYKAIVVGVSAGGFRALRVLLSSLPEGFPVPVIIVQHRMAGSDNFLVFSLDNDCRLTVKESDEKEMMRPGVVYLAPADYHLLVEKNGTLSLSVDEPVCYARPSIDVLFETAAEAYGSSLIGIILTGANSDGSMGIKRIKQRGGLTIAQNPETAESKVMPLFAIKTGAIDFIMELSDIPTFLMELLEEKDDPTQR